MKRIQELKSYTFRNVSFMVGKKTSTTKLYYTVFSMLWIPILAGTFMIIFNGFLLPTGSEESGVLGVRNIPVAILPSCQNMKTMGL